MIAIQFTNGYNANMLQLIWVRLHRCALLTCIACLCSRGLNYLGTSCCLYSYIKARLPSLYCHCAANTSLFMEKFGDWCFILTGVWMDSEYTDLMWGWEDTWLKLITVDKTREAKPNTINTRRGADKIKQEVTKHENIHTGGN